MTTQFMRNYIDLINEADSGPADIGQIAASLKFLPTTKLARKYQFVANGVPGRMPAMTYTVAAQEQPVVTVTSDGKETQNVAAVNDIIMSGPSQENYVVKAAKFPKLYQGAVGRNFSEAAIWPMSAGPESASTMMSRYFLKNSELMIICGCHHLDSRNLSIWIKERFSEHKSKETNRKPNAFKGAQ